MKDTWPNALWVPDALHEKFRERGFAFVPSDDFHPLIQKHTPLDAEEERAFAASWDTMPPDVYLARTGIRRRRRHGVFEARVSKAPVADVTSMPARPHYQSLDYNALQGGFPRHLPPIAKSTARSPALRRLIAFGADFFAGVSGRNTCVWDVEAHQFRIEASDSPGQPTPEGHHRDGVDYVLVVMIRRTNLKSGATSTHDDEGNELGHFTLRRPYDAALVNDRRVLHGVTPVTRLDSLEAAFRDVLVLTYRHQDVAAKT